MWPWWFQIWNRNNVRNKLMFIRSGKKWANWRDNGYSNMKVQSQAPVTKGECGTVIKAWHSCRQCIVLLTLTLSPHRHWFYRAKFWMLSHISEILTAISQTMNRCQVCLYLFYTCISHGNSKYGHKIPTFDIFYQICYIVDPSSALTWKALIASPLRCEMGSWLGYQPLSCPTVWVKA